MGESLISCFFFFKATLVFPFHSLSSSLALSPYWSAPELFFLCWLQVHTGLSAHIWTNPQVQLSLFYNDYKVYLSTSDLSIEFLDVSHTLNSKQSWTTIKTYNFLPLPLSTMNDISIHTNKQET